MALIPTGAQNALKALDASGRPITYIYNDGAVTYDTTASKNQTYAIYNGPNGHIAFTGQYNCSRCSLQFSTSVELENHSRYQVNWCNQHVQCFASWGTHVQEAQHISCPFPGCAKAGENFGTNERYLQHYRNKHYGW